MQNFTIKNITKNSNCLEVLWDDGKKVNLITCG